MSDFTEFFLNSPSSVVQLELLEISHPDFTQTYYIVRNAIAGVTVTLENAAVQFFQYRPVRIKKLGESDDLDSGFAIDLGDLGEILPTELDAVREAGTFDVKPTVKYRAYRSDDLTAPMDGPYVLEVTNFSFNQDGASFEAKAPSLNVNQTGEIYRVDRFSGLRGFL